jgi:hypothetical protein
MASNKRGLKTKEDIVNKILLLKKTEREGKLTAKKIRTILLKTHSESSVPKERAINNILNKNKEKIIFNDLDLEWSIGACLKYDIPSDEIYFLCYLNEFLKKPYNLGMSIREARWVAKLRSTVEPNLRKWFKRNTEKQMYYLYDIARFYSHREELCELNNTTYLDTKDIDGDLIFQKYFDEDIFASRYNFEFDELYPRKWEDEK